ncbi:MAG TPA: glycosyltransferase [Acidimicrobiales bacterium]|nr:glycosyltransferase [Acidimicrobiales bacterium]
MGAVLVLPTTTAGQQGPVAALLSTAGWLAACERVVGPSWLVTPEGVLDADAARRLASGAHLAPSESSSLASRLPLLVKTAVKDVRQYARGSSFEVDVDGPWRGAPISFVWQRHELFHTAGLDLADALGVPSVVFAPAVAVWEAKRWGVARPGWGSLVERLGEAPALRRASVLACGSDEVAAEAVRIGADPDRIVITPTGVEIEPPAAAGEGRAVRTRLGLGDVGDAFVLGWVGSFRPFHALHRLVEVAAGLEGVTLLLVGDGPERPAVEARARELGVRAVFTGTVPHLDLPRYLAAMDAAAVIAPDHGEFHYSPLKLAEYLAAGLPVVAPDVETVSSRLVHEEHALLVLPADRSALRAAIVRLRDDATLRERIGAAGRAEVEARWSWDEQVRRVVARLTGPVAGA